MWLEYVHYYIAQWLAGEIMAKTLAKIARPQAQHLCQMKTIPGSQPRQPAQAVLLHPAPHPLQQQQQQQPSQVSQHLQAMPQLQQPPKQMLHQQQPQQQPQQVAPQAQALGQAQQPVPHLQHHPHQPQQQQQQQQHQQQQQQPPVQQATGGQHAPALLQQQQQHYPNTGAAYGTAGVSDYDPAMYQLPRWHNPHQHPYGPGGVQVAPPGATLPPFDIHSVIPAPPPHPADPSGLLKGSSSSLSQSQVPPPPAEAPPAAPTDPHPSQHAQELPRPSSAQLAASTAAAAPAPNQAKMPVPTAVVSASSQVQPQAGVNAEQQLSSQPAASGMSASNILGAAPSMPVPSALSNPAQISSAQPVATAAQPATTATWPAATATQSAVTAALPAVAAALPAPHVLKHASPGVVTSEAWSDSDMPPGVDAERSQSDAMDTS